MAGFFTPVWAGLSFILAGTAIAAWQAWRAAACPRHRPWAGRVALILALGSIAAGLGLLLIR